jgi:kynurenine aminotransferase
MPGGKIVYVSMHPPKDGATVTSSASNWTIDFGELERAITPRTKMLVLNTPRELHSKIAHCLTLHRPALLRNMT